MARAPSAFQSEGRHRVAVLALDSVVPFDLSVVCQVFGSWHPDLGATRYDMALCATAAGPVRTANGFFLEAPHDLDPLARLCLHLVRRDRGEQVANAVARRLVVCMLEHLARPLTVHAMAERAGMSRRTFARRSPLIFRHHFARVPRTSARAYRAAFRGHASERSGVGGMPARAPATCP